MRLSEPRIQPVQDDEATDEQREILAAASVSGRPPLNVQRTTAQHPDLARARQAFSSHIMRETSLLPRHRELLILRTGWNCQSEYEFAQHARYGRSVGLSDEEIRRVAAGPDDEAGTRSRPACCAPPMSCTTTPSSATPPGTRSPSATRCSS